MKPYFILKKFAKNITLLLKNRPLYPLKNMFCLNIKLLPDPFSLGRVYKSYLIRLLILQNQLKFRIFKM